MFSFNVAVQLNLAFISVLFCFDVSGPISDALQLHPAVLGRTATSPGWAATTTTRTMRPTPTTETRPSKCEILIIVYKCLQTNIISQNEAKINSELDPTHEGVYKRI
jgi:hypothetical protein